MTNEEFRLSVLRTDPSPDQYKICAERADHSIRLLHAVIGITTESGELADNVKRALFYGIPFDTSNIKEELGDLLWYITLCADCIGSSLEIIMDENVAKLKARYPETFSETAAVERKDKE